jgi:hypothetical protein
MRISTRDGWFVWSVKGVSGKWRWREEEVGRGPEGETREARGERGRRQGDEREEEGGEEGERKRGGGEEEEGSRKSGGARRGGMAASTSEGRRASGRRRSQAGPASLLGDIQIQIRARMHHSRTTHQSALSTTTGS